MLVARIQANLPCECSTVEARIVVDTQALPVAAASVLLGPPPIRAKTIDALLDPLSDAECNTHLFILILDAALLTIFPEMAMGGTGHASDVQVKS
jgi:hypothetical protein